MSAESSVSEEVAPPPRVVGVRYGTEAEAFRRVEALRRESGIWTGVVRHKDGTFSLRYDPAAGGNARYGV